MDGFRTTERLRRAVHLVASSSSASSVIAGQEEEEEEEEFLEKCKLYQHATVIPYEFVKALSSKCVQIAAKSANGEEKEKYMIHNLLRGSEVMFKAPKRRTPKTPEFARKLDRIRERLEEQKYEAMVADVTKQRVVREECSRMENFVDWIFD